MADQIIIRFSGKGGKPHTVEIDAKKDNVAAVFLMPDAQVQGLLAKEGKQPNVTRAKPPRVKVKDQDGNDVTAEFEAEAGFGPGVCYMVGVNVFCW